MKHILFSILYTLGFIAMCVALVLLADAFPLFAPWAIGLALFVFFVHCIHYMRRPFGGWEDDKL